MGLVELILILALIGCLVYFITTYIPMAPPFKAVITIVAAVVCILVLVRAFGLDVSIPTWGGTRRC
jgi:peptidoglycan/LPS O-acetylase OafA/YrhL